MPQTVLVWAEDEDRSGVETGLAAITDDTINTSGDKITIPDGLPYIAGILVGTEGATYIITDARLASPNIGGTGVNNLRLHKAYGSATTKKPGNVYDFFGAPLKVGSAPNFLGGDTVTAYSLEADEAGVAHMNSISLFVTDTKLPYYNHPNPAVTHVVKFTTAAIAAALTWEAKALVLDDDLPVGDYRLWGADLCSATAIAARFIGNKTWGCRPGFIPRRTQAEEPHPFNQWIHPGGLPFTYRGGALGLKLEFCAEATDTPLSGALFLQKTG